MPTPRPVSAGSDADEGDAGEPDRPASSPAQLPRIGAEQDRRGEREDEEHRLAERHSDHPALTKNRDGRPGREEQAGEGGEAEVTSWGTVRIVQFSSIES